jgi:hypothetical protein
VRGLVRADTLEENATVSQVIAVVKTIVHWIYGLRPANGSLRDYLNVAELVRVVLPALLHGGGVHAVLAALQDSAGVIFAAPYVSAAVAVLTALVQVARLLDHGAAAPAAARA